jgi:hypothetical protein
VSKEGPIDGLRKAARRVFWEVGNLNAAQKDAVRKALLEKAEHCDRMAEMVAQEEWIERTAKSLRKPIEWARIYAEGKAAAYHGVATGIRVDLEFEDED